MTKDELKAIREKISCPQIGDGHYGDWGILTVNQRLTVKRLLDHVADQEECINCQNAEIEQYRDYNKGWMEKCDVLRAENEALNDEIKRLQCCDEKKDPYVSALIYRLIEAKDEAVTTAAADLLSEVNARIYPYKTDIYIKGEELIIIPNSDYNFILSDIRKIFTKKGVTNEIVCGKGRNELKNKYTKEGVGE